MTTLIGMVITTAPQKHLLHAQGSVFSAVLGELLDAVRWPQSAAPGTPGADGSPKGSPKRSSNMSQGSSPARISALRSSTATATLAAHPYRPLYLSGMPHAIDD